MNAIFVLKVLMFIPMLSFASPFDVADVDQNDKSEIVEKKDNTVPDDIEPPILQRFQNTNDIKLIILNITNSQKQTISLHLNETKAINDIQFTLKNCQLEIDSFMNKISIATIEIHSKNLKAQNFLVTNSSDTAIILEDKFLVTGSCL